MPLQQKKNKITFDSECWAEIVDYYNVACDERKKDYFIMSTLWILILALKNHNEFNKFKELI